MKRFILFIFVLTQSLLYAVVVPGTGATMSPEYIFMQDTYRQVFQHQNLSLFFASAINQGKTVINTACADVPAGEDCDIGEAVTITIDEKMATASTIFFGAGEGFSVGEQLAIPIGALTYRKLANSRLTDSITLDTTKIEDEDMDEIITFSWNDDGNILRVYYEDVHHTYANVVVLMDKNGTKKMVSNGYFDARPEANQSGTYVMEVQETGTESNGIIERLCFKDHVNNLDVLSKGIIDNNGGYVFISPWNSSGVGFDANGNPSTSTKSVPGDNSNGAILNSNSAGNYTAYKRFAIVKSGETVGRYTILGYISEAYGSGYEYEYFGLESLLADSDAASDSDQLDIYALDDKNKPIGEPVTNMWLTKE